MLAVSVAMAAITGCSAKTTENETTVQATETAAGETTAAPTESASRTIVDHAGNEVTLP